MLIKDTLPIILTLLIASIPVALPTMTVLALSLGSHELAYLSSDPVTTDPIDLVVIEYAKDKINLNL